MGDAFVLSHAIFLADQDQLQVKIQLPDRDVAPESVGEVTDRLRRLLGS